MSFLIFLEKNKKIIDEHMFICYDITNKENKVLF